MGVGPNFYNLYHDSLRTPGAIAFMTGAAGKFGVLDRVDIGGAAWTNSLPPFGLLLAGLIDIGGRFDLKVMLTPRDATHGVAVTGSIGGCWPASTKVDYGDAGHGSTWNAGTGLIYSYTLAALPNGRRTRGYLSLRADRFTSGFVYDTGDSVRRRNDESIFADGAENGYTVALGVVAGSGESGTSGAAIEVATTFVPNPWTGNVDWIVFGGLAFSFR